MKFEVQLDTCLNHGQCSFSAPKVFALDDDGQLGFRKEAEHVYVSPEVDEAVEEDVEEAADMCPAQAIRLLDQ